METDWIGFREARALVKELTGETLTIRQSDPAFESLLWHTAKHQIRVTAIQWLMYVGGKWESIIDNDSNMNSLHRADCLQWIYEKATRNLSDEITFKHFDVLAGSFEIEERERAYTDQPDLIYRIIGMKFDAEGIYRAFGHPQDAKAANEPKPKGRPPANWWPDFATELACFIHQNGIPETQEALIAEIQSALSENGKEEPSRAQVQPVVREIFRRIGPAGKS